MAKQFDITVSGDLAGVISMPKQIEFAAAQTLTGVVKRAQVAIIKALPENMVVRGDWFLPSRKFGIKVKTASRADKEAIVYSMADWLLEMHGANAGIKRPKKGGKNLALPDDENVRRGFQNKVPRGEKARKLLDNTKRTKAFKITARSGAQLILQRVGLDGSGNIKVGKNGNFLRGKVSNKNPGKLVVKYSLRPSAKVPFNPVIFKWAIIATRLHLGSLFRQNLANAIRTARNGKND